LPFALAALAVSTPSEASVPSAITDPARAYVAARAASISGDHAQAAQIYSRLATRSNDAAIEQRAISEAIGAGDMALALRLVGASKQRLTVDSKLLLVADALRRGKDDLAIQLLGGGTPGPDLAFWQPLVRAWQQTGELPVPPGRVSRHFGTVTDEIRAIALRSSPSMPRPALPWFIRLSRFFRRPPPT